MSSPNITRSRQIRHLYQDAKNRNIENSAVRYWSFRVRQMLEPNIWNLAPEQPPSYGLINEVSDGRRMDESLECWSNRDWYRHAVHEAKKTSASRGEIRTCETQAYIACRDSPKWSGRRKIYAYTTIGTKIRFWLYYSEDLYLTPWGPGNMDYIDDDDENFSIITKALQDLLQDKVRKTGSVSPRPSNVTLPEAWQGYEASGSFYSLPKNDPGVDYQAGSYPGPVASASGYNTTDASDHGATYAAPYSARDSTTSYNAADASNRGATYAVSYSTRDSTTDYYPAGPSTGDQVTAREPDYYRANPPSGYQGTTDYYPAGPSGNYNPTEESTTDYYPAGPSRNYNPTEESTTDSYPAGQTGNYNPTEESTTDSYPAGPSKDQTGRTEGQDHSSPKSPLMPIFVRPKKYISQHRRTKGHVTYKFETGRTPYETQASDWKAGVMGNRKCSVYTADEQQFYTWELPK